MIINILINLSHIIINNKIKINIEIVLKNIKKN